MAKKGTQRRSNLTGYKLFMKEFYEKNKGKKMNLITEGNPLAQTAWEKLKDNEKDEYRKKAIQLRGPVKGNKYILPFYTRCTPKQFMELCKILKDREDNMKRLEKIGFHKLINISYLQINWHLCCEFMHAFDPPTKIISIRGKRCEIMPNDVSELMGLPCDGGKIEINVKNEDVAFKELTGVYGKLSYNIIASWLIEEVDDENFEFLFVMYALETLLCPNASVQVSDRILKVMVATDYA